ncbi:hypothetical protein [Azospirillum thiophilum]|uniref:hypothetical protein n=1 Tax=Azospirillum thiophilum TaxID=528244 RepID=UPI000B04BCE6|nr:hypothetical protein [Azospirillum thiophilum]
MRAFKSFFRLSAVVISCTALSGCSGLVDRFLEWAGLDTESHKSICMIVMPPRVAAYSYSSDRRPFENAEFPSELVKKIRHELKKLPRVSNLSAKEIEEEERRYYVVMGMRSDPPNVCGKNSNENVINVNADYRQCIRMWAEKDYQVIAGECGDSPAYFAAGTEIILPSDGGASVSVKVSLINVGTSITSLGKDLKASIRGNEISNLRQQDLVDKVVQVTAGQIAQGMERLFDEVQQR